MRVHAGAGRGIRNADKMTMEEANIRQNSWRAWLLAARPKTLTGAMVPVMIGLGLSWADASGHGDGAFGWIPAVLCMSFAMLMQIDANLVNDFFDCVRGNDEPSTRLGPLRACTQGWVSLGAMKRAIAGVTAAACIVGLPLVVYGGWEMVLVGLACVAFCFLYTTHLSYVGMGDVLVLFFFGIVPVTMTYYVQSHTLTWQVVAASVGCGLVVDCLLIVNNYRDRDNDMRDGKRTLVVAIGAKAAERLYLTLGILASLLGLVMWYYGHAMAFVLPLLYLVLHVLTWRSMRRIGHGRELNACLGETARNILVYGLTVTAGLLLS